MANGMATFADLLRSFRDRAELTQEELAERAGISPDAVGLLERGERRRPHADTIARLAAALELSAAERAQFESVARRPAPLAASPLPQLPTPRTALVGRAEAIDAVAGLFQPPLVRLVTLTGPGGVGKTRLALAVAAQLGHAFADGVLFVPLASLASAELVAGAIATVLGVQARSGQTLDQRLTQTLQPRQALLVLDNFEHLLAAAPLVSDLLAACPQLAVLVTSRAPLRLAGEQQFAVPPFELPATWQEIPLEYLSQLPAVAVFAQQAQAVMPSFSVTPTNGETILAICRRLDGLPLAIELAAAWVKLLPPQMLLERLDRRLPLLVGGPRDLPERQRTMHDTIAWSYDLLSERGQVLLRRLSVCVSGFALSAAEAIGATGEHVGAEVLAELAELIDASLLQRDTNTMLDAEARGAPRYSMLETVREFALEQLHTHGEVADAHDHLTQYLLALAGAANAEWDGPQKAFWLDALQRELGNFRTALGWAREHDDAETLLRLTALLWKFWDIRGYLSEGRAWLQTALSTAGDRAELVAIKAPVLEGAGLLAFRQSDYAQARTFFHASLELYRLGEDPAGMASVLNALGLVAWHIGDYDLATAQVGQSLELYRSAGQTQGIAWALNNLGNICYGRGEYAATSRYFAESLALERALGNTQGIASSLNNLGSVAYDQGDFAVAHALFGESLALKRALNMKLNIPSTLLNIAKVELQQGDTQAADAHCVEALALWRELGDGRGIAVTLSQLGQIACATGAYARAHALLQESLAIWQDIDHTLYIIETIEAIAALLTAQALAQPALSLFAATDTLRNALGSPIAPVERRFREQPIAAIRTQIDAATFAAIWAAGQALTLEQVIAYAAAALDDE